MSERCAGPGCFNAADPRWGGFCDGHGVATEEERRSLLEGWRERNETVRTLLADVREYLAVVNPVEVPPVNAAADRRALLKRINAVLEGAK